MAIYCARHYFSANSNGEAVACGVIFIRFYRKILIGRCWPWLCSGKRRDAKLVFFGNHSKRSFYTVRRFRFFARRRFKTFFPPGLALRAKKPCVLLLFFFLGWYVVDILLLYHTIQEKQAGLAWFCSPTLRLVCLFYRELCTCNTQFVHLLLCGERYIQVV